MDGEKVDKTERMAQLPDGDEISTEQWEGLQRLAAALSRLSADGAGESSSDDAEPVPVPEGLGFTLKSGRYFDKQQIGKGGMGTIYRVTDRDLGRLSAMKVALPELLGDAQSSDWLQSNQRASQAPRVLAHLALVGAIRLQATQEVRCDFEEPVADLSHFHSRKVAFVSVNFAPQLVLQGREPEVLP